MENKTRFDLTRAMARWEHELSSTPGLLPGEIRELRAHLLASIEALRERGLGEEESFWLACRRLGTPGDLAEEFLKGDPSRLWKDRLRWLAAGVLAAYAWASGFSLLFNAMNRYLPGLRWQEAGSFWRTAQVVAFLFLNAGLVWLAIQTARGRLRNPLPLPRTPLGARLRQATLLGGVLLLCLGMALADSRLVSQSNASDAFGSMLYAGAAIQLAMSATMNGSLALLMAALVCCLDWGSTTRRRSKA